ncbi:alanine racemase, partial [Lacticaseibacillus rhamnosus]
MTIGNLRPATVLIDETAILHNVQHEVARLKKQTQLFAVVKADAYGHGMLRVAHVAKAAGASGFCVALLDEALDLRAANYTEPVLVLGIVPS